MSYPIKYNIGLVFHRLLLISSCFSIFFVILETIKPGFIVHFTYIVPYLLFTVVMAIGSMVFYRKPILHRSWYSLLITILIHLAVSVVIFWYVSELLTQEDDYTLLISFIASFVYFIHTLLFLNSQQEFLK